MVTAFVAVGMIGAATPSEVMAAAWVQPAPLAAAPLAAPLVLGAVGVLAGSFGAPGDPSQESSPKGGQVQRQSRQSQRQGPSDRDDDDDDDFDGDPFFADDPPAPATTIAPAPAAGPVEDVIEIEVPEGYSVEYEIIEEGAPATATATATAPTPTPTPTIVPRPGAAAKPRPTPPAMTTVELRSRRPVIVERYDPQRGRWVVVCETMCTAKVPRGSLMRVRGERRLDIPASKSFRLPRDRDRIRLDIRPGSREQRAAGVGLALLSATGLLTGAVMIRNTARYTDRHDRTYEGYLVGGMAAITFIAGIAMAVTGKTRVRERATGKRLALIPAGVAF